MISPSDREPPREVWYDLDEALALLEALEDARDALIDSGHFSVVVTVEAQVQILERKLGFDGPEGDADAG